MKRVTASFFAVSAVMLAISMEGRAQDRPAQAPASADPRASLKAGFRDAGSVARNMELVSTMPKPQGFFDPKAPAGSPAPARTGRGRAGGGAAAAAGTPAAPAGTPAAGTAAAIPAEPERPQTGNPPNPPPNAPPAPAAQGLNFSNSDMAFRRADMFLGNFNGFNTYDIESPKKPRLIDTKSHS